MCCIPSWSLQQRLLLNVEGEMTCSLVVTMPSRWLSTPSSTQQFDDSASTQMAKGETYSTIELPTTNGSEFRSVSATPARPPREDEIPLIDLTGLGNDLEARKRLAEQVRQAIENAHSFTCRTTALIID